MVLTVVLLYVRDNRASHPNTGSYIRYYSSITLRKITGTQFNSIFIMLPRRTVCNRNTAWPTLFSSSGAFEASRSTVVQLFHS
jgi:hypothetical protein